ncbi:MAG: hypothetical protein EBZ91_13245, partial [Gammaproteobacteria bacterium]|nr:hypothetical protein [Gammaproteobacteria bacterium]
GGWVKSSENLHFRSLARFHHPRLSRAGFARYEKYLISLLRNAGAHRRWQPGEKTSVCERLVSNVESIG